MSTAKYDLGTFTATTGQSYDLRMDAAGNLLVSAAGPAASGTAASGNPVPVGGDYNSTLPTNITTGERAMFQTDQNGNLRIHLAGSRGAAADGTSNALIGGLTGRDVDDGASPLLTAPLLFNGTTWDRDVKANATARLLSAANTTNSTLVKNAAGNLFKITGYNAAAALRYLKLYNKASAPTVGTDTPVWTEVLPATAKFTIDFVAQPLYFATGIGFGLTTAGADNDTGALTAADITGLNIAYS